MSIPKLLSRDEFREGVFKRDNYKCVFCDKHAQDAHHILERRLWPDGGYYLENGASVCSEHHLECEQTKLSVEDVRHAAKISKVHVPPQLYDDHIYDKWGNPVLSNGARGIGPLFFDESVQKILGQGKVLDLFTPYVKYPRTMHLPWSPGVNDDDKIIEDLISFEGQEVVATKKLDGENTSMYSSHIHARSIDSRGGEDRAWVKQFWSKIAHDIPEGWRVCGENLWAEHSIPYSDLKSYFYGFSIWEQTNICLHWDVTLEYFDLLGIQPVPILYRGVWNEEKIRELGNKLDPEKDEGFVVRTVNGFQYSQFQYRVAKYVRAGHVQTTKHWRAGRQFKQNRLHEDW